MQIAAVIVVILVVGAILGSTLNFAGVFLGIPIVFVFLGGVLAKEQLERQRRINQMRRFRRDARAKKVEFSEEDKRTMVS
jgi:Sec-independent protein secretion pathway component TatC